MKNKIHIFPYSLNHLLTLIRKNKIVKHENTVIFLTHIKNMPKTIINRTILKRRAYIRERAYIFNLDLQTRAYIGEGLILERGLNLEKIRYIFLK